MLFDLIDKILHNKKQINTQLGDDIVHPYILNRWLSMYSPEIASVINNTGNWLYDVFDNHQQYYRFLQMFLPRVKQKRIYYIKKSKTNTPAEEPDNIKLLAQRLELSKREIKSLLEYERQHRPINTNNQSN